jgi:hypothetical protein
VPNRSKLILRVHAIARVRSDNPLRGSFLRMAIFGASAYATFLWSEEIRLVRPIHRSVAEYYMRFRFALEAGKHGTISHLVPRV